MMKKNQLIIIFSVIFVLLLACALCYFFFYAPKAGQKTEITEADAIKTIQNQYSEFQTYPSDSLPPKTIQTQQTTDGWYVAFVQEGSGKPIISANCFFVNNDKSVKTNGVYEPAVVPSTTSLKFSAETCQPVAESDNNIVEPPTNQLANPASANCVNLGGTLEIQKRGDQGEYGLCYFEDNRACEEWALLRGDCPLGGVKTTGFDTIDQEYCAWSGGETFAVPNSVCTFKDGTKCSTISFYNGTCTDSGADASAKCELETCHGFDKVTCGPNPPDVCSMQNAAL